MSIYMHVYIDVYKDEYIDVCIQIYVYVCVCMYIYAPQNNFFYFFGEDLTTGSIKVK